LWITVHDRSVPCIREQYPQVFIENGKNLGFTGGNNQECTMLKRVDASVANNDATTEPDTLEKLVKAVDDHEEID
jgi:GT2 family glycosyltransferase